MRLLDDVRNGDKIARLYGVRGSDWILVRHQHMNTGLVSGLAMAGIIGGEYDFSVHYPDGRECFELSSELASRFGGDDLNESSARRVAEWVRSKRAAASQKEIVIEIQPWDGSLKDLNFPKERSP